MSESNHIQRVLIVDDDQTSSEILMQIFNQLGCETQVLRDGIFALEELIENNYDLIVLDWDMPFLGGRSTLRLIPDRLKNQQAFQLVNVIIYTGMPATSVEIPYSNKIRLMDYWDKNNSMLDLYERAGIVIWRLMKEKTCAS